MLIMNDNYDININYCNYDIMNIIMILLM